jgi:hypothetical protein
MKTGRREKGYSALSRADCVETLQLKRRFAVEMRFQIESLGETQVPGLGMELVTF